MLGSEYHSTRNRWEGIEAALTSPASRLIVGVFAPRRRHVRDNPERIPESKQPGAVGAASPAH
jgi:hypothetical protein